MKLNPTKGNMYDFITHTGNAIKGACEYDCYYCYMKRWGKLNPPRLDRGEFVHPLPYGKFIWVGSSIDMFAPGIPKGWIDAVLQYCYTFNNEYFWQSKNPEAFMNPEFVFPELSVFCTTIETNRYYPKHMGIAPYPEQRAEWMNKLHEVKYVTIEPIIDFDVDELFELIVMCKPEQVNIGADSGGNKLPEPSRAKIMALIDALSGFTTIHRKTNLKRLLK